MTEHMVEVNGVVRHWFSYTTDKMYFIDLNNTSNKIEVPAVPIADLRSEWVPNKSKCAQRVSHRFSLVDENNE